MEVHFSSSLATDVRGERKDVLEMYGLVILSCLLNYLITGDIICPSQALQLGRSARGGWPGTKHFDLDIFGIYNLVCIDQCFYSVMV